jgi:hypothetical protein
MAIGQSCRIIQPWIGPTRIVESTKQVAGRANAASASFDNPIPTARDHLTAGLASGSS